MRGRKRPDQDRDVVQTQPRHSPAGWPEVAALQAAARLRPVENVGSTLLVLDEPWGSVEVLIPILGDEWFITVRNTAGAEACADWTWVPGSTAHEMEVDLREDVLDLVGQIVDKPIRLGPRRRVVFHKVTPLEVQEPDDRWRALVPRRL